MIFYILYGNMTYLLKPTLNMFLQTFFHRLFFTIGFTKTFPHTFLITFFLNITIFFTNFLFFTQNIFSTLLFHIFNHFAHLSTLGCEVYSVYHCNLHVCQNSVNKYFVKLYCITIESQCQF